MTETERASISTPSVSAVQVHQDHVVTAPILRANIAQAEFARLYPRGTFLPYVHEAIDTLPERIARHIEQGRPAEAEYWLLMAEKFAGCIDGAALQRQIAALGPLETTEQGAARDAAPGLSRPSNRSSAIQ